MEETPAESDFLLGDVVAEVVFSRAEIVVNVRHTTPRMAMDAVVGARIYPAGSNTAIFSREDIAVDFAPNTIFPLTIIDREGLGISPSEYLARVQIEYGGRTWEFERVFTVTP